MRGWLYAITILCGVLIGCEVETPLLPSSGGPEVSPGGALAAAGAASRQARKAGRHRGEQKQLAVDITFFGQYGETVTDENGTHYYIRGQASHEDKVYPSEYWDTFPLYYFNTSVGVTVTVTNHGPRAKAKLRIRTEAYLLRTDGTSGPALTAPRELDIEVNRGETRSIDASFVVEYSPQLESGLDRFLVKVSHPNAGGGPGNEDPALILVREGVFCPPEYAEIF